MLATSLGIFFFQRLFHLTFFRVFFPWFTWFYFKYNIAFFLGFVVLWAIWDYNNKHITPLGRGFIFSCQATLLTLYGVLLNEKC